MRKARILRRAEQIRRNDNETQTIVPYWFLMRAAGHLTGSGCQGNVYTGTCPLCKAQEILMNAAMRIGYVGTLPYEVGNDLDKGI